MKCPENLSREDLWRLLGAYANAVGAAKGVLFTHNPTVLKACAQFESEVGEYDWHSLTTASATALGD